MSRARDARSGRGFAAIGLDRPKDLANLGGALRAAHCFGAELVVVGGDRYRKSVTDTTKAYRHIPLVHSADVLDSIPYDCVPVAVEFIPERCQLQDYQHPQSAFYVFGPEDGSIRKETLARCRDVVYIPSRLCLNLAAAVNVLLYDRTAKMLRGRT